MQVHIPNKPALVSFLCFFVGLAPTFMLIPLLSEQVFRFGGTHSKGILGEEAGLLLLFWARIPGLIFGEPAFQDSAFFGIVPNGFAGWVITVLFWTGVSVIFWFVSLLFRRKINRSGSIRAKQAAP